MFRLTALATVGLLVFAPVAQASEPQAIAFPERLTTGVLTLPDLYTQTEQARIRAQAAHSVATLAQRESDAAWLRATQAEADVRSFARTTYVSGMPTALGMVFGTLDRGIGPMLHDWSVQRRVGTDRALRAVDIIEEARSVGARAASHLQYAERAQQAFLGRQQLTLTTQALLQRMSADLGYPDLLMAFLSRDADGCITQAPAAANPLDVNVNTLCHAAIADADDRTSAAIQWGLARLGAPYACKGIGRDHPLFQFDCSSFVSRAYQDGAGVQLWSGSHIPTTATMLAEGSRFSIIAKTDIRPGDLVVYDTCNADEPDLLTEPRGDGVLNDQECASRHVVMYLGRHAGQDWMIHSTSCGRGVTVDSFWGMDDEPGQVFRAVVRVRL